MLARLLGAHPKNLTGYGAGVSSASGPARVFRLPRSAYLAVLFVLFGTIPLAFTAANFTFNAKGGAEGAPGVIGWQCVLLVIPVLVAVFIARTATIVDERGIRIRVLFGSRMLPWSLLRGLSVDGRNVYAVAEDGAWRLPCVHVGDLAEVARASGGRLPQVAEPKKKYAPQRRRRR
jgi:hypothetical protein